MASIPPGVLEYRDAWVRADAVEGVYIRRGGSVSSRYTVVIQTTAGNAYDAATFSALNADSDAKAEQDAKAAMRELIAKFAVA